MHFMCVLQLKSNIYWSDITVTLKFTKSLAFQMYLNIISTNFCLIFCNIYIYWISFKKFVLQLYK